MIVYTTFNRLSLIIIYLNYNYSMNNNRPWCLYDWQWAGGKGPGSYSWYHFLWIFILIVGTFLLIYFIARKHDKKKDLLVCRIFAIELVILEVIKIITNTIYYQKFYVKDCVSFAFCSIPTFFLVIASFFKSLDKKVPNACIKLGSYIGLIGGLGVMIYPAKTLSYPFVWYSIHTMLWHSSLACFSIYFFISMDLGKSLKKDMIPLSIGTTALTITAISLNEILYYTYYLPIGSKYNPADEVNFFWISRHFDTSYPVLGIIKKNASYTIFAISFLLTILLLMVIIHYVFRLIKYHTIHKVK